MARWALATAVAVALAASGCLSHPEAGRPTPAVPPADYGLGYACSPASAELPGGVCAELFVTLGGNTMAQAVAASPVPGTFAVVVFSEDATASLTPDGRRLESSWLLVTEDFGQSWARRDLPRLSPADQVPPAALESVVAESLAFTQDGALHVLGSLHPSPQDPPVPPPYLGIVETPGEVLHLATPDLGRTWSEPVFFGQTEDDRTVTLAANGTRLAAFWRGPEGGLAFARSPDGGAEWAAGLMEGTAADCPRAVIRAVATAEGAVVACEDSRVAEFLSLPWEGPSASLSVLEHGRGMTVISLSGLARGPDGRLVYALAWGEPVYFESLDGGRTWGDAVPILDGAFDNTPGAPVFIADGTSPSPSFDGYGNLHLRATVARQAAGPAAVPQGEKVVLHVMRTPGNVTAVPVFTTGGDASVDPSNPMSGPHGLGAYSSNTAFAWQGGSGIHLLDATGRFGIALPVVTATAAAAP